MSLNKWMGIGNVGRDPETRTVMENVSVSTFTMACTERGFTKANGEKVDDNTQWFNIVAWRGLSNLAENYIKKGSKIFVEGKIQTREYTTQDGNKKYITEVVAENIELLSSINRDNNSNNQAPPPAQPPVEKQTVRQQVVLPPISNVDDDLPF